MYLEIGLSTSECRQKHGGFDVTIFLLSWYLPLTSADEKVGANIPPPEFRKGNKIELYSLAFSRYISFVQGFLEQLSTFFEPVRSSCQLVINHDKLLNDYRGIFESTSVINLTEV